METEAERTERHEKLRAMLRELSGTSCQCGKPKQSGQTFCKTCYYSLPQKNQRELYRRVGEGYEGAYERARLLLSPPQEQEALPL